MLVTCGLGPKVWEEALSRPRKEEQAGLTLSPVPGFLSCRLRTLSASLLLSLTLGLRDSSPPFPWFLVTRLRLYRLPFLCSQPSSPGGLAWEPMTAHLRSPGP